MAAGLREHRFVAVGLVVANGGSGYWIIQTILTSTAAEGIYKSIKDAIDDIKAPEDAQQVIYDPENGVEC